MFISQILKEVNKNNKTIIRRNNKNDTVNMKSTQNKLLQLHKITKRQLHTTTKHRFAKSWYRNIFNALSKVDL